VVKYKEYLDKFILKGVIMKDKNIVLIGMPGAGKSTIGVLLAKTLNKPFIDTDLLIQQREKDFLQNIIRKKGIDGFLSIEESIILETDFENHVIATGGSVVYSEKSMEHLKKNGLTVYLNHTLETIEKRIIFEIIFFIKFLIFFNIF